VAESGFGPEAQRRLAGRMAFLLIAVYFGALLIGDRPFAVEEADKAAISESGSLFNRMVIFGTLAASLPIILVNLGGVLALLARNLVVGLLIGWFALSYGWAMHPELTGRRVIAFALVYGTLVALASAGRSARQFLWPLSAVFALITILNFYVLIFIPEASWSPIGETGIFDNKNTAGTMAMLTVIMLGTGLFTAPRGILRLLFLGLVGLAWLFLLLTRSKTSIGVTALLCVGGPVLYIVLSRSPAVRIIVTTVALCALAGGIVLYVATGHDDADLRMALFGDLTFTGRTDIWSALLPEIARRPWLGYGFGSFWDVGLLVNPIRSAAPGEWFMEAQLINTAHDGYLDTLLQSGIIGLSLAVLTVVRTLWLLAAAAGAAVDRIERMALTGALCLAICLMLNNFLESYLFRTGDALGYLFLFLMLQGEAARRRQRRRGAHAAPA
jgi:O-antigen ligase